MATKAETIKGVLARLAKGAAKPPEITKLPAEDPKPSKGNAMSEYEPSKWPVNLSLTDKQLPAITKMRAGEEGFMLVRFKLDAVTTHEKADGDPNVEARVTLLEVAKL